jgi:hypothetical protein
MPMASRTTSDRGSALLIAIILVGVMAIVGLALVTRTTTEIDAVGAKRHYDIAVSCADGARQMLMSSFRTFGASPASLTLDKTVGDKRLASGHYDTFALQSVVGATGSAAGATGVSDIANRTSRTRLGGQVYRMTVVCSDSNSATRQSEVEFLVRFGL